VKSLDDAGSGAQSTALALEELNKSTYDMVLCGINSTDAVPCTAAIGKRKILQISVAGEDSLSDPVKSPSVFNTLNRFHPQTDAAVLRLKKDKKTKVVLIAGNNAAGQAGASAFQESAKKGKITITDTIFVPLGTADATPQLQKAMSSGAQAMVMTAFTPVNIAILRARAKLGWNANAYLDQSASAFNYSTALTPDERKGVFASAYPATIKGDKSHKTKEVKRFLGNVKVYDPKPQFAIIAHMVTYNAIMVTRAAALKAKSTNPGKMISAMKKVKRAKDVPYGVGLTRYYSNKAFHAPDTPPSLFKWFKLGSVEDGLQVPAS
jgi:ABC-type branched-subunit amino acid transport system substrate-binding protein